MGAIDLTNTPAQGKFAICAPDGTALGSGTAGTPSGGVQSVQGVVGGTPVAVAGVGVTASASFTNANAAYGAGDLVSVAQELAFTFSNGVAVPSGSLIRILTTIIKIDEASVTAGQTSYTGHLYNVTPPSAQADNAAWTLASADLTAYRGPLSLGTPVDKGAAQYVKNQYVDTDVKLTGTSLWLELITDAALTGPPAAVARQVLVYGVVL